MSWALSAVSMIILLSACATKKPTCYQHTERNFCIDGYYIAKRYKVVIYDEPIPMELCCLGEVVK